MVPVKHPYIAAYLERKDELTGLGNAVRISIETTEGDIFTQEYMDMLRKISDEVFFHSRCCPFRRQVAVDTERPLG